MDVLRLRCLLRRLNELRLNNHRIDFALVNEHGDRINVHLMAVVTLSAVVKNRLKTLRQERQILLRNVSVEAMEQLVNFMYLREIIITAENVNGIIAGAEQLEIAVLIPVCVDYMAQQNIENIQQLKSRRYG